MLKLLLISVIAAVDNPYAPNEKHKLPVYEYENVVNVALSKQTCASVYLSSADVLIEGAPLQYISQLSLFHALTKSVDVKLISVDDTNERIEYLQYIVTRLPVNEIL